MPPTEAIIVPGFLDDSPKKHWLPGAVALLEELGVKTSVHLLCSPTRPVRSDSVASLENKLNEDRESRKILVGYSMGATAILHLLRKKLRDDIDGVVFVSGAAEKPNITDSFLQRLDAEMYNITPEECEHLRALYRFSMIHSTDDKMVTISMAERLAEALCIRIHRIMNAGHIDGNTCVSDMSKPPARQRIPRLLTRLHTIVADILQVQSVKVVQDDCDVLTVQYGASFPSIEKRDDRIRLLIGPGSPFMRMLCSKEWVHGSGDANDTVKIATSIYPAHSHVTDGDDFQYIATAGRDLDVVEM